MYRGRLAPSPTGLLHRGHAHTFWIAHCRCADASGDLILRNEDLDHARVRPEYVSAMIEDLRWLGVRWHEGPDIGGPHGPYTQSERIEVYREAFELLLCGGWIYPCVCTRRDVAAAAGAPHADEDEPVYPGTCRPAAPGKFRAEFRDHAAAWRFRVPDGEELRFADGCAGEQSAVAGVDFGDFPVWRKDGAPSYQFACVVDDARMNVTEVVRGADLIRSTFRQILLYRAFGWQPPAFFHCPLVLDERRRRLSKRDASTTIRSLREAGASPASVRGSGPCAAARFEG
jgi:glutamyl-tRNA synthetase